LDLYAATELLLCILISVPIKNVCRSVYQSTSVGI
jgi:hypothetical protein